MSNKKIVSVFRGQFLGVTLSILTLVAPVSFAEVLRHSCEVSWMDVEKASGALRFGTSEDVGIGLCLGKVITTAESVSERQKDQIFAMLLSALLSGSKITAEGDRTDCVALSSVTIKAKS
ncbi:MAG: hypothetical protein MK096_15010 [Oleiphilaceae bacterium]|nr:hypothetical protein [Oleiphilaceae bacterium]